jgi:hypothetical protein
MNKPEISEPMALLRQLGGMRSSSDLLMDVAEVIVENGKLIDRLSKQGLQRDRAGIDMLTIESTLLAEKMIDLKAKTAYEVDCKYAATLALFGDDHFASQLIQSLTSDYCSLLSELRADIRALRRTKKTRKKQQTSDTSD